MKSHVLASVLCLSALWPASAAADGELAASAAPTRVDRRERVGRFEFGYRQSFIQSSGLDPFSTQDFLPQLSIGASRTVAARGPLSFAPGIAWDYAGTSATARGDMSFLTFHRLTVTLEGRLRFGRWGYAFVRGAPGVAYEKAEVDDPSVPGSALTKSRWLFAGDVSGGYSFPLWSRTESGQLLSRFWAQADGGYGFVADQELNLSASGQPRAAGVDLGVLGLSGAFFRLSLAASL